MGLTLIGYFCAMMLITSVSQAHADFTNCADFCKSVATDESYISQASNCDCSSFKSNSFGQDDNGIYYEPTELFTLQKISFISPPFYILNPAKKKEINSGTLKASKIIRKRKLSSKHGNHHRNKPKDGHSLNQVHFTIAKLNAEAYSGPLYLDIDIHDTTDLVRSVSDEAIDKTLLKLSEKEFKECVEVYTTLHLNNNNYTHLSTIKSKNTLNDSDLNEINKKCSQPADMVIKSLQEIKNKWYKPRNLSHRDSENAHTFSYEMKSEALINTDYGVSKINSGNIINVEGSPLYDDRQSNTTTLSSIQLGQEIKANNLTETTTLDTKFYNDYATEIKPRNNLEEQISTPQKKGSIIQDYNIYSKYTTEENYLKERIPSNDLTTSNEKVVHAKPLTDIENVEITLNKKNNFKNINNGQSTILSLPNFTNENSIDAIHQVGVNTFLQNDSVKLGGEYKRLSTSTERYENQYTTIVALKPNTEFNYTEVTEIMFTNEHSSNIAMESSTDIHLGNQSNNYLIESGTIGTKYSSNLFESSDFPDRKKISTSPPQNDSVRDEKEISKDIYSISSMPESFSTDYYFQNQHLTPEALTTISQIYARHNDDSHKAANSPEQIEQKLQENASEIFNFNDGYEQSSETLSFPTNFEKEEGAFTKNSFSNISTSYDALKNTEDVTENNINSMLTRSTISTFNVSSDAYSITTGDISLGTSLGLGLTGWTLENSLEISTEAINSQKGKDTENEHNTKNDGHTKSKSYNNDSGNTLVLSNLNVKNKTEVDHNKEDEDTETTKEFMYKGNGNKNHVDVNKTKLLTIVGDDNIGKEKKIILNVGLIKTFGKGHNNGTVVSNINSNEILHPNHSLTFKPTRLEGNTTEIKAKGSGSKSHVNVNWATVSTVVSNDKENNTIQNVEIIKLLGNWLDDETELSNDDSTKILHPEHGVTLKPTRLNTTEIKAQRNGNKSHVDVNKATLLTIVGEDNIGKENKIILNVNLTKKFGKGSDNGTIVSDINSNDIFHPKHGLTFKPTILKDNIIEIKAKGMGSKSHVDINRATLSTVVGGGKENKTIQNVEITKLFGKGLDDETAVSNDDSTKILHPVHGETPKPTRLNITGIRAQHNGSKSHAHVKKTPLLTIVGDDNIGKENKTILNIDMTKSFGKGLVNEPVVSHINSKKNLHSEHGLTFKPTRHKDNTMEIIAKGNGSKSHIDANKTTLLVSTVVGDDKRNKTTQNFEIAKSFGKGFDYETAISDINCTNILHPEHGASFQQTRLKDTGVEITGNLFFVFDKYNIPARFVQKDNGKVSIGMDGASLCAKLNSNNSRSLFINALCKCLTNKKSTNS